MLKVGNKNISVPIETILKELRFQLEVSGIHKLSSIKTAGQNIQCTCPIHSGGTEHKPSCGVFLVPNKNFKEGDFHCFTCGKAGTFSEFVSSCWNKQDGGLYGENWLLNNFEADKSINIELAFNSAKKQIITVTEDELQKYRYYHDYMWKRGLTPELVEMFDIGYDIKTDCITFPVKDEFGNCVFVARRSTKTKFFNYPLEVEKPVYALDMITDDMREVYVVESFFNCLTCWKYGKPAIALMGLGTTTQYDILRRHTNIQRYILAFDGDSAGRSGAQRFHKNMKDYALISYVDIPEGQDINDLDKEFLQLKPHI